MSRQQYQTVNAQWPDKLPPLTAQEAVAAVKRLWRFAMKRPLPTRRWRFTSGNRYNNLYRGIINPERGWHDLVHHVSHRCHARLYPGEKAHDEFGRHAFLEKQMIQHVIASGWLDGKLRRDRPAKPKPDVRAIRHQRVVARIEAWESKRKRAETALRKLRRQRRYYEGARGIEYLGAMERPA